jgi:hypothetical protein
MLNQTCFYAHLHEPKYHGETIAITEPCTKSHGFIFKAQTSKDFPIFTLKFCKEPIAGPDFRQFQLFQMRRMAYGIAPHPIIMNLEECKRAEKTANILGIGVVNDEGTSIGPLNLEVVWTNAEAIRLFKSVKLSGEQAVALLADAVKEGKGMIRKY